MIGLINGSIRILGLGFRFLLSLYMARFMAFEDIGIFAIVAGITALTPLIMGFGLTYYLNREIIGAGSTFAMLRIRDRLLVTSAAAMIASAVGVALILTGLIPLQLNFVVCALILTIEMVGSDLHLTLISRHRTTLANILLFVRTSAWIPAFISISFIIPQLRTIEFLTQVWLAGLLIYLIMLIVPFRRILASRTFWISTPDFRWLITTIKRAPPMWVSDVSLAGGQYIDRFVITAFVGLEGAGVYYFYFSIINSALVACQSATLQMFMPILRTEYLSRDLPTFKKIGNKYLLKTILVSAPAMVITCILTIFIIKYLNRHELIGNYYNIYIIALAIFLKSITDYFGIIDYVLERDKYYAGLNLIGLATITILSLVMIPLFNLTGAAIALLMAYFAIAIVRVRLWRDIQG